MAQGMVLRKQELVLVVALRRAWQMYRLVGDLDGDTKEAVDYEIT